MKQGQTFDIKKGTKFFYFGELVTYKYFSIKYKVYHFSNSVCPDNQLDDMAEVMANQDEHKNWVYVPSQEQLDAEADGGCLF